MTNIVQHLQDLKLINPPKWVASNTHYLTLMGSMAYGCNKDDSDNDVYGFCMPPKTDIFPHLDGHIYGFGNELHPFEQYQQHHIMDTDVNKEYDLTVYSIVKYFNLLMGMNPNMVDSLFTPVHCIKHITEVGQMVRDNKTLFAHKGCYHKFRGYAYAQRAKMVGHERSNVKRKDCIDNFGYDLKFAYHLIRLMLECEQLLRTGTMDLTRDKTIYMEIRNGEWTLERINKFFTDKETVLDELYNTSKIPYSPNVKAIKELLLNCIEQHYGKVSDYIVVKDNKNLVDELKQLISKYGE